MRLPLYTFLCTVCLVIPGVAQDALAETVLDKHLAARGGITRLKALETIRIRGAQVLMPSPLELPMLIEQKRPNLQRVEMTVQGMTEISTFDGREGWVKTPWAANKAARPMEPEQIKGLAEHDFDTPYLFWKEKGWKAEHLGTTNLEGHILHKVQLTVSNTEAIIGSFDQVSYQEIQREHVFRELGSEIRVISLFGDYRMVQGLSFPFYMVIRAAYRGGRFKLLVDRVEVNATLPAERFAKP